MHTCSYWPGPHGLNSFQVQGVTSACHADQAHLISASKSRHECYRDVVAPFCVETFTRKNNIEHFLFNDAEYQGTDVGEAVSCDLEGNQSNPPASLINGSFRVEGSLIPCALNSVCAIAAYFAPRGDVAEGREACAFIAERLLIGCVGLHKQEIVIKVFLARLFVVIPRC